MVFGLWESKSSAKRTQPRRPLRVEELSPRIMLSDGGMGDVAPTLPLPPSPPPVENASL